MREQKFPMQTAMLRKKLKRVVPGPLWRLARRIHSYAGRRATWWHIRRQITGATPADREILKRSSRRAWLREIRDLDDWHDPLLLEDATVDVHGVGCFELRTATDDLYHVLPYREQRIFDEIRARLRGGDVFVDAGANIGVFTVLGGNIVGAAGKVVAIEMIPETAAQLRRHVELNRLSNVKVVERALSERPGQHITASIPEGRFGQASIVRGGGGKAVSVETTTLDEVLSKIEGPISLLKVDLEGAEAKAFAGATHTLARTQAVIFEELGDSSDIADLLAAAGFTTRHLDAHNLIAERS
jgi:FkbM family methyltransferase